MTKKEYNHRLEFEHNLINRRVTWLITSQAILFAAYSLGLSNNSNLLPIKFLKVTAYSGLLISLLIFIGIVAAALAKRRTWEKYKAETGNEDEPFGVETWITYMGLIPDFILPFVFAIAWIVLLC